MNKERTEARMSNREALAAALDSFQVWAEEQGKSLDDSLITAAARERLAQLPEQCPECQGTLTVEPPISGTDPHGVAASSPCFACHGSGKVYPAELVNPLARIIYDENMGAVQKAVAVLDALNGETE